MLSFILDHRYISERNWTSLHHRTKSILLFDAAHDTAKLKSSPLLSDTDLSQQLTPRIASGSLSFPTLPGLCPMVSTNLVPGSCCPHKGHPCPGDCRWDKSELLEGHTNTALVSSQHPFRQESRLYPSIFTWGYLRCLRTPSSGPPDSRCRLFTSRKHCFCTGKSECGERGVVGIYYK